jgi:hypothetical protein
MLGRFITNGYVLITHRVTRADAAAMARTLRGLDGWAPLFGPDGIGPKNMDPNRGQRRAPDDIAEAMRNLFRPHWLAFFPMSEGNDWVAIRSFPGGVKQPPHTDFTFPLRFPHVDYVNMPAGIIVALEPGTHLFTYGWNRLCADPKEEVRVELDVGDAIIFRGDLIHACGAYETENIRLHAYLDVVGIQRPYNRTFKHPLIVYDQGDLTRCPLHGCDYAGSRATVHHHLGAFHRARFNLRRARATPARDAQLAAVAASGASEDDASDVSQTDPSRASEDDASYMSDSEGSLGRGSVTSENDAFGRDQVSDDVSDASDASLSSGDFLVVNVAAPIRVRARRTVLQRDESEESSEDASATELTRLEDGTNYNDEDLWGSD